MKKIPSVFNLTDLFKNILSSSQDRSSEESLSFKDLYSQKGLIKLDHIFCCYLKEQDPDLFACYEIARQNPETSKSELLLKVAVYVEDFLSHLFSLEKELKSIQEHHNRLAPLYTVKRQFVQRYALSQYPEADPITFDFEDELTFAQKVIFWSTDEEQYKQELDKAARYAAWATLTKEGQKKHEDGILFKRPKKIDPSQLIDISSIKPRDRQGFNLTDPGFDLKKALDQVHYCIKCHPQNKDFCSKGYPSQERFRRDAFGHLLTGCPLEQKISEMNELKAQGHIIGALAIICIDNPMVAATGYRICNECMKACIFQKQESVHIPGIETQILKEVLSLPYGFEIYSLLTRWNPLSLKNPLPKEPTGKTVLVVGMGPAGFTLSHYLLREGHAVVGIDGLKIEPIDESLKNLVPIKDYKTLKEDLSTRLIGGFGGVAEYGITVRWDKNFLKVIRLLLERQNLFRLYGGVRFGGTFGLQQAFEEIGFSHVALCMGAGRSTMLDLENGFAKGMRQASDFLMSLHLSAFKKDSLTNLQIRLPIVVIGGGLTAIDAATEALAYYPLQVEKFLSRYETLVKEHVEASWNEEERVIACEFLSHGRALRSTPHKGPLLQSWGGSTIVYRKPFNQSPSYTLNHEEVIKALEEGISIVDSSTPKRIKVDKFGWVKSLIVDHKGEEKEIPCKTILVAAGTKPNVSLDEEFLLNEGYFQAIDEDGKLVTLEKNSKPKQTHVLIKKYRSG
ncbi:MAG: FAD-dependent oxidoreductase, partial [Proteobacteria bacterium]|nr:FAD-dependent oxidoreductase [Pseudomonadota bacterium]